MRSWRKEMKMDKERERERESEKRGVFRSELV